MYIPKTPYESIEHLMEDVYITLKNITCYHQMYKRLIPLLLFQNEQIALMVRHIFKIVCYSKSFTLDDCFPRRSVVIIVHLLPASTPFRIWLPIYPKSTCALTWHHYYEKCWKSKNSNTPQ